MPFLDQTPVRTISILPASRGTLHECGNVLDIADAVSMVDYVVSDATTRNCGCLVSFGGCVCC